MAWSGTLLLALCGWAVMSLPLPVGLRLLAAAAGILALVWRYSRLFRQQRQIRRIRLYADGSLQLLGPNGNCSAATVGNDSVVLAGLAWLRLDLDGGRWHAELLRGNCRQSEDWRRFQVIWKHLPRRPGRRLGSDS